MKLITAALSVFATFSVTDAFVVSAPKARTSESQTALSMSTGLYFGTIGGATKRCANYIAEELGGVDSKCEIEDLPSTAELLSHDSLILGAPTWNTGADTERSMTGWDTWLYSVLPTLDLTGKKVAVFGVGDQMGYPFNYCDAVGELRDQFMARGADVSFGHVSTEVEGYKFVESKAMVEGSDGKVAGMLFDEDNENDQSEARAKKWAAQLKEEGFI